MKTIQQRSRGKGYTTLALALLAFITVNAQPGPPPPPPGGGIPPPGALQAVSTYQGKVVKMAVNDDFVYDGFYILDNGDSVLVHFPPHLGTKITAVIKVGSSVSVNGVLNTAPLGEKEIRMVNITAGGETIADTGGPTNDIPTAETYVSANGKITQLQTNREGEVIGVIVDSRTILRIPPHIARQLSNALAVNAGISYTGMQKPVNNGESVAAGYKIVRCKTITVNGQQYVVE